MRQFVLKISFVILIAFFALAIKSRSFLKQIYEAYHYDTFNVFHWKNIRFTSAEPNKNFVKTQFIVHNPKKFNAFIFGSSRVGNLPKDFLPKVLAEKNLLWYNMTYSEGVPKEHLESIKTFLSNDVCVDVIVLGFDNISMYASMEQHGGQLLRMPYQVYENDKFAFYKPYLQTGVDESIMNQVEKIYNTSERSDSYLQSELWFYDYGTAPDVQYIDSLTENPDLNRYEVEHAKYPCKESHKDIEEIVRFCRENNIKLFLFTSPLWQITYKNAVDDGYFDFLRLVAKNCEFYNFSSLNNYTKDPRYYFEWSHYRPALGLLVEKMLFGTEDEKAQIRKDSGDELWGIKVNAENADFVIQKLHEQLE